MSVNPPGGVNLTLAIFALVSTALSIVGFIAHYIPCHQYGDFCSIFHDINDIFADDDWQLLLPSDRRTELYRRHGRHVHALLSSSCIDWCKQCWQYFCRSGITWLFGLKAILRSGVLCRNGSETAKPQKQCITVENWADRELTSRHTGTVTSCDSDQDNWCYSIFIGSLSNRERQKNPEDHGDSYVTLLNEQDSSWNAFKPWRLRMPTGIISKEVWSFLISFKLFDGP